MTDKQIMIDGVDVSGCKYWKGYCRIASLCDYPGHLCEVTPNCNYKNWKRKEQECERLKDIIETKLEDANICDSALNYINDEYIYVKRQLDQLKAENEKLQDIANKLLDERNKYLDKWSINLIYKQTLAEIKEIAERDRAFCIKCNGDKDIDCIDCIEGGRALLAKDILQKISEVENGQ